VPTSTGVDVLEAAPPDSQSDAIRPGSRQTALVRAGVALVVLVGLLIRLWVLGRQPVTAPTEIPGLMANQILHGHFYAFYWGQNYGGVEPYVVAAMFAVFGHSAFTLGLTPVLLDAVAALLVWRVGRRLFGPRVGVGAALLFWIWPEAYIFQSTLEYGFRYVTLVCGLAVMLLTIRICQRDEPLTTWLSSSTSGQVGPPSRSALVRQLDWLALGVFAGIGWWASPEIVYYLVPSGVFLAWKMAKRRVELHLRDLLLAATVGVLGALPWIWDNAHSRLGSLHQLNHAQPDNSYTSHLSLFFTHTMPVAMGLRLRANYVLGREAWVPGSGSFLVGPSGPSWLKVVGVIAYVLALLGLVIWIRLLIRQRRSLVLVGAVVLYPFAFAMSPFAWDWHDGRYGLFLAPLLALLLASGADHAFTHLGRPRLSSAVAVVVGLALTLTAVTQLNPYTPVRSDASRAGWFTWSPNPNPEAVSLTRSLESAHLDHVWAGFDTSWLLDWESGGRITASDVRYPNAGYYRTVATSDAPAWLFVEPGQLGSVASQLDIDSRTLDPGCLIGDPRLCVDPASFEAFLARQGIGYRIVTFGAFIAVAPSRSVSSRVMAALQTSEPSQLALR
jgi:4-amino-4-deoxy-L-arabinose transferase-like glycosyltransferase